MSAAASLDLRELSIPGLSIESELGSGAANIVFRVDRRGEPYALKVRRAVLNERGRASFTQEVAAAARVRHPHIVEIYSRGIVQSHGYIVMELLEGGALSERIGSGLSLDDVCSLAVALARALSEIHCHGMLHGDIKPSNIMYDESGCPKLIDFGLARRMDEVLADQLVAGTLEYCSPEQSRTLKRPVDQRSDLYSLGVTLFESVTAKLPFLSDNTSDLLLQHATAPAPSVLDLAPNTSPALAAIIAKLLEKDPDDRYQSAATLLFDLREIERFDAAIAQGASWALGAADGVLEDREPTPLVGRIDELERIQTVVSGLRTGRGGCISVEGEPGSGKSRLVREVIRQLGDVSFVNLTAKCVEGANFPYAPLRQILDALARKLKGALQGQDESLQASLDEIGRQHGGAIARLSRAFSEVIQAPDTVSSSLNAEQFATAVSESFRTLARSGHCLVIAIDDVQWIDSGTQLVLKQLTSNLQDTPILVLTSGRNNVESSEELERFLAQLGDRLSMRLQLGSLAPEEIERLVSLHLGDKPVESEFADQVSNRSSGNPFAVGEYIRAAMDAGLLEPDWDRWSFNGRGFERLELPSDVISLVVRRIDSLREETRQVLVAAAILGIDVRAETLAAMLERSLPNIHDALVHAIRANLLERGTHGDYGFVHDRVREALESMPSDEERTRLRRLACRALESGETDRPDIAMALARHHAELGNEDPHKAVSAATNAATKALEMFSDRDAYQFFRQARSASQALSQPLPVLSCMLLGGICLRLGLQRESFATLNEGLDRADEPIQRAQLHAMIARAHLASSATAEAESSVRLGLEAIDRRLPTHPVSRIFFVLVSFFLSFFARPRKMDAERTVRLKTLCELYDIGAYVGYFNLDNLKFAEFAIHGARPGRLLGPSKERVLSDNSFGIFIGSSLMPRIAARYHDRAIETAEQLGDRFLIAKARAYKAWSTGFSGMLLSEYRATRELLDTGYAEWMDIIDYMLLYGSLFWQLEMRGRPREAAQLLDALKHRLAEAEAAGIEADVANSGTMTYLAHIYTVVGRVSETTDYVHANMELARKDVESHVGLMGYFLPQVVWQHIELGELGEPLEEAIELFRKLRIHPALAPYHNKYFFVIQGYARLEQAMADKGSQATMEKLRAAIGELAITALVPILRCHLAVLKGGQERLRGRWRRALKHLERADRIAQEIDCPWVRFETARQRAHLWRTRGVLPSALEQANLAAAIADATGAVTRLRRIRAEFELRTATTATRVQSQTVAGAAPMVKRRLEALLEVSLSAATEIRPEAQARLVLDQTIRLMGAQRGYFFVFSGEGSLLEMGAGRDERGQDLSELTGFSRTVVERVRTTEQSLIVSGTRDAEALQSQSVVAHDLRSIIAAPVRASDRLLGVLYLDSSVAKGIFGDEDLKMLEAIAGQLAVSQVMAKTAELELHRQALERDLALTRTVQTLLLPEEGASSIDQLSLCGTYQPASQCSGDWWTHRRVGKRFYDVFIGDVTGHGTPSAMVTAAVAGCTRALQEDRQETDPGLVMERIDRVLHGLTEGTYWMTMTALRVDLDAGQVRVWCAGSPPLLVQSPSGEITTQTSASKPLGGGSTSFVPTTLALEPGARIVLFTDGLTEMQNAKGRPLRTRRLKAMLDEVKEADPSEALARINQRVEAYRGERSQEDDYTIVLLDYQRSSPIRRPAKGL